MTNEALVELIQQGDNDELAPLMYAKHKGLVAFRSSGSSEVEVFVLRRLARSGY